MMCRLSHKAFTLIELLIVVAIIAILAAIAVPNFLEAQTRAKVSRVKNDHRAIAVGLEGYAVDHNLYPPKDSMLPAGDCWANRLTPPIAYASCCCEDPFSKAEDADWKVLKNCEISCMGSKNIRR